LVSSGDERQVLGSWVRGHSTRQVLALRSGIVLACVEVESDGLPRTAGSVATAVGVTAESVCEWRKRFVTDRLDGPGDARAPAGWARSAMSR
jgi:hypothetical protein